MFQAFVKNFLRGLLFVVPVAATSYVIYIVFVTVDRWANLEKLLNRRVPGAGIVLTVALITTVGFFATHYATRSAFRRMDRLFTRLPLVKLLYTSLRDLIEEFVGTRSDSTSPCWSISTRERAYRWRLPHANDLTALGLAGHCAVYLPHSPTNFAGQMIVVRRAASCRCAWKRRRR